MGQGAGKSIRAFSTKAILAVLHETEFDTVSVNEMNALHDFVMGVEAGAAARNFAAAAEKLGKQFAGLANLTPPERPNDDNRLGNINQLEQTFIQDAVARFGGSQYVLAPVSIFPFGSRNPLSKTALGHRPHA